MPGRVLLTLPLPEPAGTLLAASGADIEVLGATGDRGAMLAAVRRGIDVLCPQLSDPVDPELLDAAGPRLRAVCTYAVGVDNIDVPACTARGVAVGNTPGVLTEATADCALGLMLAARRRLCEGDALLRRGDFVGWRPAFLLGHDLRDALLGVVGFGRIGQALARRALACGMRVVYAERSSVRVDDDLVRRVAAMPFASLIEEADVVSLHVPLTSSTMHLVDADVLRRMRPTAVLVNTARGAIVDEVALVTALREGWIAGAGLDVYEDEPLLAPGLTDCANAVLSPHLGSATVETRSAMAKLCAHNALAALAGEALPHWLNPDAWAAGAPPSLVGA